MGGNNLTRVEALDVARDLLENYLNGNGRESVDPNFEEAYEVLTKMRNGIQKQNIKNKINYGIKTT